MFECPLQPPDPLCTVLAQQDAVMVGQGCANFANSYSTQTVVVPDRQLGGFLPTQIGRLSSSLLLLDANHNRMSGTIPTQVGELRTLHMLMLHDNFLSGTLPTELGRAAGLVSMLTSGNRISGTLPTQVGGLTRLGGFGDVPSELRAAELPSSYDFDTLLQSGRYYGWRMGRTPTPGHPSANAISGTLPSQLAYLNASLTLWEADGLRLSGTIPAELDAVLVEARAAVLAGNNQAGGGGERARQFWQDVDLSDNRLAWPGADAPLTQYCVGAGGVSCKGVPPDSCSAFAGDYRLSFTEAGSCLECPPLGATLGLLGLVLAIWLSAMAALYRVNTMAQKSAKKAARTIFATASIVIGQVQIVHIFTELNALQGSAAADVAGLAAAAFADPSILRVECILPGLQASRGDSAEGGGGGEAIPPQTTTRLAILGLPVATFAALALARVWHGRVRRDGARADKCARLTLLLFMLQLSFVTTKGLEMVRDVLLEVSSDAVAPMAGLALLGLEAAYLAALWCDARGLARLQRRDKGGGGAAKEAPPPPPPTATLSGGGADAAPDAAPAGNAAALSRRATRLEPLTEKYGAHAPYWQFVVWGRTVALIALETFITPQVVAPPAHAYVQTAAAAAIVLLSLALQLAYAPFAEEALPGVSQNRLEAMLLGNNVVQLATAAVYHSVAATDSSAAAGGGTQAATGGRTAVDAILCALFVAPAIMAAAVLLRSRRLRRALTGRRSSVDSTVRV